MNPKTKKTAVFTLAGVSWSVMIALGSIGIMTLWHWYHDVELVPWLSFQTRHAEYCPIPIVGVNGTIHPPECLFSTDRPRLICDCSRTPKQERPAFTSLLAYINQHPLAGMTLVTPILPGDPPSREIPPGLDPERH